MAGDEIVLRVQPVDPIDPFRGAYVTLGYPDLRHNDAESADGGMGSMEDGEEKGEVFVSLARKGEVWVATDWSRERPTEGRYLRCNDRDWRTSARAKSAILNDSRVRLAEWVRDYGLACEFANSGEDYVYRDAREFEHTQGEVDFLRELGVRVDVVDGPTYERIEPALKPGLAGAIRFDGDAVLRPDRYVAELARVVRERGGVIVEQCALEGVQVQNIPVSLLDAHVDAIRVCMRDQIKGDSDQVATMLAKELDARVTELLSPAAAAR